MVETQEEFDGITRAHTEQHGILIAASNSRMEPHRRGAQEAETFERNFKVVRGQDVVNIVYYSPVSIHIIR